MAKTATKINTEKSVFYRKMSAHQTSPAAVTVDSNSKLTPSYAIRCNFEKWKNRLGSNISCCAGRWLTGRVKTKLLGAVSLAIWGVLGYGICYRKGKEDFSKSYLNFYS